MARPPNHRDTLAPSCCPELSLTPQICTLHELHGKFCIYRELTLGLLSMLLCCTCAPGPVVRRVLPHAPGSCRPRAAPRRPAAPWVSANVLTAAARRHLRDLVSAQGLWSCCLRPTGSKVLLITPPIKEKVLNVLLIIIQAPEHPLPAPRVGSVHLVPGAEREPLARTTPGHRQQR